MLRVIKEAYIGEFKVTSAPDYIVIAHAAEKEHEIVFNIEEAKEVVNWLSGELNRVLPDLINVPYVPNKSVLHDIPRAVKAPEGPVYEPGPRHATQTVELKLGDPNLAYRATGGRTGYAGDGASEVMDLGALSLKVGKL